MVNTPSRNNFAEVVLIPLLSMEDLLMEKQALPDNMIHTHLHESFDSLVHNLTQLKVALREDAQLGYKHWVPLSTLEMALGVSPIEKSIELYQSLFFIDGQESNHTRSCHGLISISQKTATIASAVNQSKAQFQSVMQMIKKQAPKSAQEIPFSLPNRHPAFRLALNSQSLNRLHLKQCYRQLPLLQRHPSRVGFTWSLDGKSITKISHDEAEKRLLKLGEEKPHIQAQLEKLRNLDQGRREGLRKVQKLAPAVKANLVFRHSEGTRRKTINAPLPLLFPAFPYEALPPHKKLDIEPPKEHLRLKRLDTQLSDEPFLKTINVYLSEERH